MTMIKIFQNKSKQVFRDDKTGLIKEVWTNDPKYKEEIAKGVSVQPYGKGEREFLDRYRQWKKKPDGTLTEPRKDKERYEEWEKERLEHIEKEDKRRREIDPGYKIVY